MNNDENTFVQNEIKKVSKIIDRGIRAMNNNDYISALHLLKRAVNREPQNTDALKALGDFYKNLGEIERAIEYYTLMISINPLNSDYYYLRTSCRSKIGDYVNALSDINMTIIYNQPKDEYILIKADILTSLKLWDKAIEDYNSLINKNEENIEAYLGRGYCFHQMGEYEAAINDYTKGIEIVPDDYIFYCQRSISNLRLNNFGNALNDAEKAVELGDYPECFYCRALAFTISGQIDKGLLDVKKTLELDTDNALDLEKYFLNEEGFSPLKTSPRYKGLLESHFGVEIPGLADETIKTKED